MSVIQWVPEKAYSDLWCRSLDVIRNQPQGEKTMTTHAKNALKQRIT